MRLRARLSPIIALVLVPAVVAVASWPTLSVWAQGPIAHYPFNGGSTQDASGLGNHAVSVGAVATEDRFGNPNSAYLVGASAYLEAPDSPSLDLASAFTLTAWLRLDELGTIFSTLVSKGPSYVVYVYSGGSLTCPDSVAERTIQLESGNASNRFFGSFLTCGTGEWSHVGVAVDTVSDFWQATLYINGSSVGDTALRSALSDNSLPLRIGLDSQAFYPLVGALDDVRLYDRRLNADEIRAVYDSIFSDGFESGGVTFWTGSLGS